jgi:transposase
MKPPPLPAELFDTLPLAVQIYLRHLESLLSGVEALALQNQTLAARVEQLEAQLNQNSSNSSKPPSSDPPSAKSASTPTPSGKKRGGQPGHPKHQRTLLPPDEILDHKPSHCGRCQHPLSGDDPNPLLEQVIDLPAKMRQVLHHRRHTLTCPGCLSRTTAPSIPEAAGGFGPKLQAVTSYLSGVGRMGKRPIRQLCEDLFDIPISLGSISHLEARTAQALAPIHAQAKQFLESQDAHVDETSWKQGKQKAWLWVAVTQLLSVFLIHRHRSREAFEELLGSKLGVLITDRYAVYGHLEANQRQVCWAHLRRDFQAMIDRRNAGSPIGEELLDYSEALFDLWQRVRDGTLTRRGLQKGYLKWLRGSVHQVLTDGSRCSCAKTAGVCTELLEWEESLWTFSRVEGVEPTNNAAERALRHAVCWRKTSYGTDSDRGSRFVERILSVVASCRQQGRNILQFLTEAIQSRRSNTPRPSLIPGGAWTDTKRFELIEELFEGTQIDLHHQGQSIKHFGR